ESPLLAVPPPSPSELVSPLEPAAVTASPESATPPSAEPPEPPLPPRPPDAPAPPLAQPPAALPPEPLPPGPWPPLPAAPEPAPPEPPRAPLALPLLLARLPKPEMSTFDTDAERVVDATAVLVLNELLNVEVDVELLFAEDEP